MSSPQTKPSGLQKFLTDFMLGGLSGAIAKTVVAPLERIKLLLQTMKSNPKLMERPYTGIVDCGYRVATEEGVLAFWRGNWTNVIRYFPTQAFNFAFKDFYNKIFCPYDSKKDPGKFFLGNLFAGGMAGASGMVFVYPLDFARTRLTVDIGKNASERQFTGMFDVLRKVTKKEGPLGTYKGFGISVIGIFVYRALYFGGYDAVKKFMADKGSKQSLFERYLIAQFITASSETLSYPLDTIRRNLMTLAGQKEKKFTGTVSCARYIWNQDGLKGFFRGNVSNLFRSVGSSFVLVLYDELQAKFGAGQGKKH